MTNQTRNCQPPPTICHEAIFSLLESFFQYENSYWPLFDNINKKLTMSPSIQQYISYFDGLDGLKKVDAPLPSPAQGEVLVQIKAVSLNYRDMEGKSFVLTLKENIYTNIDQ